MIRAYIIILSIFFCTSISYTQIDSTAVPAVNKDLTTTKAEIKFSDSGLESQILSGAIDSQIYDHKTSKMHLYGDAFVTYEDKELKADYIILDMNNNIAEARSVGKGRNRVRPTFIDAGKEYKYNGLKYNFDTEKGIVYDALFSESGFFIHGEKTKYVSAGGDKYTESDDVIYNQGATITTCDHEHPHFGFKARRMKVVKDKVVVVGPSNLRLGGVATPIWLPFGFYPLVEGKSSGFIFPKDFEFNSQNLGFGLKGFGWYFPVSDYMHLTVTADAYTRGSYALNLNSNYRKRYKYNGSFSMNFTDRRFDDEVGGEVIVNSQKGYTLSYSHNQDNQAHPFVTVGGRINIVGNDNQNRNNNDAVSVFKNTYSSNFFYRHSMPNTPFNLSVGLNHNQNTRTRVVNVTFPDATLNMNTIYPFKRKNKGSNKEVWFERISLDYDAKFRSLVQTTDTTLFTSKTLDDLKTGLSHTVKTDYSTSVLKYFNIVANASYDEVAVLNTTERGINRIVDRLDTTVVEEFQQIFIDTIYKDTLVSNTMTGFDTYRSYRAGVRVNTTLFGTARFAKGWLRGIRQTIKPSVGYSYAPDSRSQYVDSLFYLVDTERAPIGYTRFDNGPFGNPRLSDLQSQLEFRVNNVVEIKHWSKKDSTEKKFKIFDNLNANMTYNFASDSLKLSPLRLSSTTRFFKGVSQLTSSWTFDPYVEVNNRSVNTTVRSQTGKLLRVERGMVRLTNNLDFRKIKQFFTGKKKDQQDDLTDIEASSRSDEESDRDRSSFGGLGQSPLSDNREDGEPDDEAAIIKPKRRKIFDLVESLRISHNMVYEISAVDGDVSSELTINSLEIRGTIPLTDNWSVSLGTIGYNFATSRLTYPDLGFRRKLHCWDMSFNWTPYREAYSFSIGVTSSNLNFLKYDYGRNNVDGLFNQLGPR